MAERVWLKNRGSCPGHLRGTNKRVAVKLRNGMVLALEPIASGTPAGWPADGEKRPKMNWALTGHAFDVVEYCEL